MGALPIPVRLDVKATGNSADGQIHRNVVDDALGAMASKLLVLLRAETITPANSSILDSLGNPIANRNTSGVKTASDANFNGNTSLSIIGGVSNMFQTTANELGATGGAGPAMTNSFSLVTGLRVPTGSLLPIFGDNAVTSDGSDVSGFYIDTNGKLNGGVGTTSNFSTQTFGYTINTTAVVWLSYDASTGIFRCGCNSALTQYQTTLANTRTGAGSGTAVYPFGYRTSSTPTNNSYFHRWTLFNKAFLNGAVPPDDAQFTALVNLYTNFI
jgi:hypothetical protein